MAKGKWLEMEAKQAKKKSCVICGGEFISFSSTARVDGVTCAIEFNRQKDLKKKKKEIFREKATFKANDLQKQLQLTQVVFNKLRRLQEIKWFKIRGFKAECISCGKTSVDWCCGHFKTVGSQGALRFDEKNTYLQCNRYCNKGLSGNINGNKNTRGYIQGLHDRFGDNEAREIIKYCEQDRVKRWTCGELIEMRKDFNKQIREITNKE